MPIIQTDKPLRPRDAHDFYPTPYPLAYAALQAYAWGDLPRYVLDPGAGTGVWGQAVQAYYRGRCPVLVGVDLFAPEPSPLYHQWAPVDYLAWAAPVRFDLICGNPPYGQAEAFVRRSLDLLAPGGVLIFLLRLAFLEGQARGRGLWRDYPPTHVGVCTARPSFTGNGKTDATAYAVYRWIAGHRGPTQLDWLDWQAAPVALPTQQPALFTEGVA